MRKTLLILTLTAVILAACASQETPLPTPGITPLPTKAPSVDYPAVVEALLPTLAQSPYYEITTPSGAVERIIGFRGVSTGETRTRTIAGQTVETLDVLLLMQTQKVLRVPVIYRVDDDDLYLLPENNVTQIWEDLDENGDVITKTVTQTYIHPFEAGAQVQISTANSGMVTPNGIDWQHCSGDLYALGLQVSDAFCEAGMILDTAHPRTMQLLVLQALKDVPEDWALAGFVLLPVWNADKIDLGE